MLEEQGADRLFGEPALSLSDLMQTDFSGNGVVSLLDATQLVQNAPRVYAALLLWLMSELFEDLPEAGDADRPKLVLFFDEAHLLFNGAPKPLVDKIEQVVRLIRSKGVGVYFVSQSPLDIPETVLGQLGLKVEHALRAFTPKDRQVIKSVAQGFRAKPGVDVERIVTELETGEALISALDAKGAPQPVARALIAPPESRIGPLDATERADRIARSPFKEQIRSERRQRIRVRNSESASGSRKCGRRRNRRQSGCGARSQGRRAETGGAPTTIRRRGDDRQRRARHRQLVGATVDSGNPRVAAEVTSSRSPFEIRSSHARG